MKSVRYWALVLSANAAVVIAHVSDVNTASNVPQIVPNKFIMEVNESSHVCLFPFFPYPSNANLVSCFRLFIHARSPSYSHKGIYF